MYPWRDGAGDVRVALGVVVVVDMGGGGRMAHAVARKRLAALGHFWHGGEVVWCVAVASERRMEVALSSRLCQCHASRLSRLPTQPRNLIDVLSGDDALCRASSIN